jgi:phage terminase large subunit-like protein
MRAKGRWINISTVTHGGKRKTERITWALQGRMEHGKIILNKGDWNHEFTGQLMDFPATGTHDDLIDALAYIDQVSVADFISSIELDEYEELDSYSGY